MRAKICGITNLQDAQTAVQHGAWALGFNFYTQSPRFIDPFVARDIVNTLPATVLKVGIVIDTPTSELISLMNTVGLDLIQVYDVMDVPKELKKRMILSLSSPKNSKDETRIDHHELTQYAYLLLDSPKSDDGLLGGTGRLSNWGFAAHLAKQYRLILAGGLTPDNVHTALREVQPYAVDVASGVQASPGKIDPLLLQDFLRQVNDEY